MKRILIIGIFAVCSLSVLSAQEGLKIGLRFSPLVSFAQITDSTGNPVPGTEVSSKLGYSYGLMGTYGFTESLGLYSGIHIVRKGFRRSETVNGTAATQNVSATTVEIPIALRGRSGEIGASGLFINGLFGVSIDVRAGYKNDFTGVNPTTGAAGEGTIRNSSFINPITGSFLFGGGTDWYLDRVGTFHFALVYHRGLININSQRNFNNTEKILINYLALDLGYLF